MNSTDKKIAIGGIILIVILAITACVLLTGGKKDSPIKIVSEVETVELNDIDNKSVGSNSSFENDTIVPVVPKENIKGEKESTSALKKDNIITGKYESHSLREIKNNDSQMQELFGYWDAGREEAVADLIRLERIRNYTDELEGTKDYFYYGQLDSQNRPNGKGLAIYADNTYYFGTFKAGLRDGSGTWLHIYPDEPQTVGEYQNVTEHFYTGEFSADLPNGNGQENYVYGDEISVNQDNLYNVIGSFKNGYYNGEMIIYTIDSNRKMYEWNALAKEGTFGICEQKVSTTGKHPVWIKGIDNNHDTDESDNGYYWMKEDENKGWGIFELMK